MENKQQSIRRRVAKVFKEKSRTVQSSAPACDINNIMKKYKETGMIQHNSNREPFYGDVSGITDFRQAMEIVLNAETTFNNLPSEVREKFENDPGNFIEWIKNPTNLEEARKDGYVDTPEKQSKDVETQPKPKDEAK